MARLLDILQSEQRWGEILDWAMRWISVSPLSEAGYRAMMIAYASTGDLVKAAETFEHFNQRRAERAGYQAL